MITIGPLGLLKPKTFQFTLGLLSGQQKAVRELWLMKLMHILYAPLHWLNCHLPPVFQLLPACYLATSGQDILGLIRLDKDGEKKNRFRIEQVMIDAHASTYDIGTQLVQYAISRYGAGGIQTFVAYVDHYHDDVQGLLKSCGFRHLTRRLTYTHETPNELFSDEVTIKGLQEISNQDAPRLNRLYSECLPPEIRLSLEKTTSDFTVNPGQWLWQKTKGIFKKSWGVEDPAHGFLISAIEVTTEDFKTFTLNVFTNPGFPDLYKDCVHFGIHHILNNTRSPHIILSNHQFNKEQIKWLDSQDFKLTETEEVLVKDYWTPIEDKKKKMDGGLVLFPEKPTPATNFMPQQ